MSAEAENIVNFIEGNDLSKSNLINWVNDRLIDYHSTKVESITDEEIEKEFYKDLSDIPVDLTSYYLDEHENKKIGAQWFKQRLLQ